jgi:hypothetical protein
MRKIRSNQSGGLGIIATAFLACSLAAFGCSTNRTPGDGQPSMAPNASPAAIPGTSSGTSNPPMASAYEPFTIADRADEAAAIMASHQRVRVFGEIGAEGPQQTPPEQMHTGQFIPPSLTANPESTINASISSDANGYITGGDVGATSFVAAPSTVTGTTASTPTTASTFPTPTGAASGTTLTPTMSSAVIPSPNSAANPPLGSLRLAPASTTTTSTGSIRVMSSTNGAITMTNVATAPLVIKGK